MANQPAAHGHSDHGHGHGAASHIHGSFNSYLVGFIVSIVLTVIPFWLVMKSGFSPDTVLVSILVLGVVQIFVHLVYFLHLNTSPEERWNLIAFAFTILVVVILIGGSVWIMYHINVNMMTKVPVE
jgi:cytochrome o ubiquinol oxidase operon protein cyoD